MDIPPLKYDCGCIVNFSEVFLTVYPNTTKAKTGKDLLMQYDRTRCTKNCDWKTNNVIFSQTAEYKIVKKVTEHVKEHRNDVIWQ